MDFVTWFLVSGLIALVIGYFLSGPNNLPPGPRPLPLLGNTRDLQDGSPHLLFYQWAKKYGNVMRIYYGTKMMIVLSGYKVIHDCLVKKSQIFANRPPLYINNTVTGINGVSQLRVGRRMVEQRKFVYNCLREVGRLGKIDLERKIFEEIEVMVCWLIFLQVMFHVFDELKEKPFDPHGVISKAVANTLSNICFGFRFEYDDPRFLKLLGTVPADGSVVLTADLLQHLPMLRFLPKYRDMLKAVFVMADNFIGVIRDEIDEHVKRFKPENEACDIIDAFLLEMHRAEVNGDKDSSFSRKQMEWFVGDLFIGGSASPTFQLVWTLVLLVANPEVYKRVENEIDDVIGSARPPKASDRSKMPYTEATILEVLRYSSPAPLAIPHCTTEEVKVEGYTIPANTVVTPNLFSIDRDPKTWKHPFEFYPGHFLDEDGSFHRPEAFLPFSAGTRVCPGEALAKLEIFIFLTSLLQRYHFRLPEGAPPLDTRHGETSNYVRLPRDLVAVKRT
ncbi:cytochrome P450 2D15-like [Liolophura sinensis]|uniref:cytochrome P450 2D15-like n=1 Tax=Liolophura sinensis TaxID=3198878 RepID=UPI003158F030